jgi:hypothetical protein
MRARCGDYHKTRVRNPPWDKPQHRTLPSLALKDKGRKGGLPGRQRVELSVLGRTDINRGKHLTHNKRMQSPPPTYCQRLPLHKLNSHPREQSARCTAHGHLLGHRTGRRWGKGLARMGKGPALQPGERLEGSQLCKSESLRRGLSSGKPGLANGN